MVVGILVALMLLVVAAVPVAAILGILSFGLDSMYFGGRLTPAIGEFVWDKSKEFILSRCRCSSCSARSCSGPASRRACTTPSRSGWSGCRAG